MFAFNITDISKSIINDDLELDRILENTNFDDHELTDMPMEQSNELPH